MASALQPQFQKYGYNSEEYEMECSESFFYPPVTYDEEALGSLFIVGKVKSAHERRQEPTFLLNYLASKLRQSYFSYTDYSIKEALTNALSIVNRSIKELYEKGELDWLRDISLVVGVVQDALYFSFLHEGKLYMVREGIVRDLWAEVNASAPTQDHFFDRIFKTDLQSSDRLLGLEGAPKGFFCTPRFCEKPDTLEAELRKQAVRSFASMSVLFSDTPKSEQHIETSEVPSPIPSIDDERSPQVPGVSLSVASGVLKKILLFVREKLSRLSKIPKIPTVKKRFAVPRVHLSSLNVAPAVIARIRSIMVQVTRGWRVKLVLAVAVLAVAGSLWVIFDRQAREQAVIDEIKKADALVEAFYSFTYDTDTARRRLLIDARELYSKHVAVPTVTEKLANVEDLEKNYALLFGFSKIKVISLDALGFTPLRMIPQESALLLTNGNQYGTFALLDESVATSSVDSGASIVPGLLDVAGERIIMLNTETGKLMTYDRKVNKTQSTTVTIPSEGVVSLRAFGQNIYALSKSGLIYKYTGTASKPVVWLDKNDTTKNPVSLGIDGDVYVLSRNRLAKFFKGSLAKEVAIPATTIKGITVGSDASGSIILWSDDYIYSYSKKTLELQKIFISQKLKNIAEVIVNDVGTLYILQDREMIIGYQGM